MGRAKGSSLKRKIKKNLSLPLNHLTQKTYPGSSATTFAYDKIGSMTSAVDSDSSVSFDYDNLYRMTGTTQQLESNPSKTIEYAYDPVGNRTDMAGPDDIANAYTYTLINQVASITDVYNNATNYYYDDGGRLTLRTYGNGTKAEYSYDEGNRLTLLANKKSDDSVLSSFTYEVDKTGNRTKRTTAGSAMTAQALKYTYDNIYEIAEVYRLSPEPTATLETFSYDGVGNRTTDADYSNYSYNSNNQLASYDSITFNYDKNGNLTKKTENGTDETTYTFDYENKIIGIDYPDETYSAYKYDALGRRIEKRDRSGNIARYVYDGQNFVAEYDGSNDLVASYVQGLGIDNPTSLYRGRDVYWYHSDALGSIHQMTDSDQAVQRSYDYSAFGKIISETGSLANPFTYTARERDSDSGLYYYRARYYDAAAGRFLSRDAFFMSPEFLSKNLLFSYWIAVSNIYRYVNNNPIMLLDPSGLKSCQECTEEAMDCVNDSLNNEAICVRNVAIAYTACLVAAAAACLLAGPAYPACMAVWFKICSEAAAGGLTYCHVVLAAELVVCKKRQSECYAGCCP
jgi:RHS repeat-associated protein